MTHPNLPGTMLAMVLDGPGQPLQLRSLSIPLPGEGQVLLKVTACGICRTDLHIIDGELTDPKLPLIPGHEIIGTVLATGSGINMLKVGDEVGVPWLAYTCGTCRFCQSGRENLCAQAQFTGYTVNGGFATHCIAWEKYCFRLPPLYANAGGAPLLCAGLIGYRSYRMLPAFARHIGFYGFGASAHLLAQVARHDLRNVYAFTRAGDLRSQAFANELGAVWVGDADARPPIKLDGAIIFAADGQLVPKALSDLDKGGTLICAGIHMSNIPSFPYELLWHERSIRSVANLTREDGTRFLKVAADIPITTTTSHFTLEHANEAIEMVRKGQVNGAAVLIMP